MIPFKLIWPGILFIVIGLLTLGSGHDGFGFSVPSFVGALTILAGFIWIGYALLHRKSLSIGEKNSEEAERIMICPGCEEVAYAWEIPGLRCPNCEVNLENLEGFYDRHPELIKESNDKT